VLRAAKTKWFRLEIARTTQCACVLLNLSPVHSARPDSTRLNWLSEIWSPDISRGHISRIFPPPGQFPLFLYGVGHSPFRQHHSPIYNIKWLPLTCTKVIGVERLRSGIRISANYQKNLPVVWWIKMFKIPHIGQEYGLEPVFKLWLWQLGECARWGGKLPERRKCPTPGWIELSRALWTCRKPIVIQFYAVDQWQLVYSLSKQKRGGRSLT